MRREPHWVKLFLRELERTGNVRISAEAAGVDFSTAYQRRKRHGEFAERWEGALGAFALRQAQDERGAVADRQAGPSTIPDHVRDGPPPRSGEELSVRSDGKVIKGSDARWGKRAEEGFLVELTVSASVRRAARAAGFSTTAVYKKRMKDRRFACAWDAALETGKARVQAYLVEAATRTFDPDELPIGDSQEMDRVSISEAINIAKLGPSPHLAARKGLGGFADDGLGGVEQQEYQEACERIIERLRRLKARMEAEERETGRCWSCGQMLANLTLAQDSA